MRHDNLLIEIGGVQLTDLDAELVSLEVELDDQLAGMFRLTVALLLAPDGSWPFLDDDRFALWTRVVVTAGLADDTRRLITGFVTHLRPEFGPGLEQCRLAIWGMDATVLMDRADRVKDWPNKKDSDIAAETFEAYGLTAQVTDTEIVHDEEVSTILQRETDIRLLKRLALRNGYECFVDGDTGFFQPPAVDDDPQPVLAVHFGDRTNVTRFSLEVNALAPVSVAMFQLDHDTGEVLRSTVGTGSLTALGARPPASFLGPGMQPGLVQVARTVATGEAEMAALAQGLVDQGDWFVTAEGEVAANEYGNVLLPRRTVTVKGIGETHSGLYYVTHVTHRFDGGGYTQTFRAKRNALMPTGAEDFAGTGVGA
jgi:phage protein D